MNKQGPLLKIDGVSQSFFQGKEKLHILKNISCQLYPGEIVGLVGASGAGKSTLLHIAGLLENPAQGKIWVGEEACSSMSEARRTEVRCRSIGFVYQFHHLLPEFTALENIMLPQLINGVAIRQAQQESLHLLRCFQLENRQSHVPTKLSGGEQQRVAILRALANRPSILLADEPTGNLDEGTAGHVFNELLSLIRERQMTALIATHNYDLAERMDRVFMLKAGTLVDFKRP